MLHSYVCVRTFACIIRVCISIYLCISIYCLNYVFNSQVENYLFWTNLFCIKPGRKPWILCNLLTSSQLLFLYYPIKCCDFAFESMIFFSFGTLFIIFILENAGLHLIATLKIYFIVVNSELKFLDILASQYGIP